MVKTVYVPQLRASCSRRGAGLIEAAEPRGAAELDGGAQRRDEQHQEQATDDVPHGAVERADEDRTRQRRADHGLATGPQRNRA